MNEKIKTKNMIQNKKRKYFSKMSSGSSLPTESVVELWSGKEKKAQLCIDPKDLNL
jgi:hypothetical protein